MKNQPFHRRLGFALDGIVRTWRRERSLRTHGFFAAAAGLTLLVARPGALWVAVVTLATAAVLALELVKPALETLIDHLHPTLAEPIRDAKDAVAGAVLVAAVAALVIGAALLTQTLSLAKMF